MILSCVLFIWPCFIFMLWSLFSFPFPLPLPCCLLHLGTWWYLTSLVADLSTSVGVIKLIVNSAFVKAKFMFFFSVLICICFLVFHLVKNSCAICLFLNHYLFTSPTNLRVCLWVSFHNLTFSMTITFVSLNDLLLSFAVSLLGTLLRNKESVVSPLLPSVTVVKV